MGDIKKAHSPLLFTMHFDNAVTEQCMDFVNVSRLLL